MRYDTTNGIRFRQTLVAANDVRYDLIQKTNNVDYTAPVISFYKGNVGIGTTNPVNILQVGSGGRLRLANDNTDFTLIGSSDANSATNPRIIISGITRSGNQGNIEYLSTTSTGMHAFYTTDSTTERMRISSDGNVGIGTTDTTTYKLNVGGTINATSVLVNGAAITASSPSQWSGTTNIYYNGGNVGIGTSTISSSYKLQVIGNEWVENQLVFNNSFRGGGGSEFACNKISLYGGGNTPTTSSSFGFGIAGGGLEYFSGGSHFFYTETTGGTSYGTERMRIANNGNVGIGTTSTGTYKLNVNGSINATSVLVNGEAITPSTPSQWSGTANIFYNGGNVGIGTNNANNILQVGSGGRLRIANNSNDYTTIGTNDADGSTNTKIYLIGRGYDVSKGQISYHTSFTGSHVFYTTDSATERMRIASDGIVSIGTTTASAQLNVSGSILITGVGAVILFNSADTQIYRNGTNGNLTFVTGSVDNRVVIHSTKGFFGIGIADPRYPLHVSDSTSADKPNTKASYFDQNGLTMNYTGEYSGISARFIGAIMCAYTIVLSDSRIKEDIQDIIDDSALQMILAIEPKTYKYIDRLVRGDKKVYGFIAQQIKEVIPEAIKIEMDYIPNIMLLADYNTCIITFQEQPTKVIVKVNDKIKCYDKDNKDILVEVIEIIDNLTFKIKELEKEYTDTKIFVYGTFVDDLHTLNKDYIFTLNVCATQELHRRIEAQNIVIKSQDDRIRDLEAKVEILLNNM